MKGAFFAGDLPESLRVLQERRARISWEGQWIVERLPRNEGYLRNYFFPKLFYTPCYPI